MARKAEEENLIPKPRRKPRSNATPRLWRGLLEWLRDGRLAGFLLALGSAAVLGYLFLAPDFQVQELDVQGNLVLPREDAVQQSQVVGHNIFLLDASGIVDRLMQVPYVRNVQIERSLPNHVRLVIEEHFPSVSWWPVMAAERYLVDDNGLVLGPELPDMPDLIYIVDMEGTPVAPQDRVDAEAVRTAQQVFSRLYNDLHIPLVPFEYNPGRGITAVTSTGWRACFGTSEHLEQKVLNLIALLQSDIEFSEVDLRLPDQIRYR